MTAGRTQCRTLADGGLVALFVGMLLFPMVGNLCDRSRAVARTENRPLAPAPELQLTRSCVGAFPARFEAFYNDRFGFRHLLIRCLNLAEVQWLKISPFPNVILGKDGWLFFTELPLCKDQMTAPPLTAGQLVRWQRVLEARRDWLAARKIRYLVVLVPEKQTVYPEDLPPAVRRYQAQESRLDQLVAHLRAHSDVNVVDVRESLDCAKGQDRIYHRTDSHWNDRGAHAAYQQIVTQLTPWFPGMRSLPRTAFTAATQVEPGGDLARMLGLADRLGEENLQLLPRTARRAYGTTDGFGPPPVPLPQPFAMVQSNPALPRALMFCDSFSVALFPFLSEHFQRIAYIWHVFPTFDTALVLKENPDVVIQEMVERKLLYPELVKHHLFDLVPANESGDGEGELCATAKAWSRYLERED